MHSLELHEITKRFSSGEVLRSISLAIEPGQRVAIVGTSGSGKTTLLRIVAGLEAASGGKIRVAGLDVTNWPASKRGVGMVFQDYATYPRLTVAENLTVSLVGGGLQRSDKEARLEEMVRWLGLESMVRSLPTQLSGGQLQRVALGKALMARPKLLLLDEPFSQLDVRLAEQMRRLLAECHERYGLTQIVVTHNTLDALREFDKLAVLEQGRLVQFDTPCQVRKHPKSLFAAELTSLCGLNVLTPTLAASIAGLPPATVAFRPEATHVVTEIGNASVTTPGIRFRCRLGVERDLGIIRLREAFLGTHRLSIATSCQVQPIGDEVEIFVRQDDLMVFAEG